MASGGTESDRFRELRKGGGVIDNPLLCNWTTPFGLAPFEAIRDDHFAPALTECCTRHQEEIDAIVNNRADPDFCNTVEALERSGRGLDRVLMVFGAVCSADSNPRREDLQREFSPIIARHFADIYANKALFKRLKIVWKQRENVSLTDEQQRILMLWHRNFVRAGAGLAVAQGQRMKYILSQLAKLGTEFSQTILSDERNWHMVLTADDLDDLPDFVVEAALVAGRQKGLDQPVVTSSRSLIVPFLQYSSRRDLRKAAYKAWTSRGRHDSRSDNCHVAQDILALREERAKLLGYESFSEYKLETEMARTPEAVRDLLMAVWKPARERALMDAEHLCVLMQADGVNGPLQPWDWYYYTEKRRKELHDIDQAALQPYLEINRMIQAAFYCAGRLFGLEFRPVNVALYHPDCRAWDVRRNGDHIGLFIGDYFARDSKRSGAWCSALRSQAKFPQTQTPIVINICNFAKGEPVLLSMDDAKTLFHEFGHALHRLLSDVTYASISGTAVARDFVELPSQLFEHWLLVPDVLAKFAVHAVTGQPMPQDLRKKVHDSAQFDMGFQTVEYLASALVDLDFHDGPAPPDLIEAQNHTLARIGMPYAIGMRHATPHFAHVFSGDGYSSGYYSYLWSEVLDADAFAAFMETGDPFDPMYAKLLERYILSTGGSRDADDLYIAFRGFLPDPGALLRGRGLVD